MPLKERIATSVLIASLTFGGAGCQDINATKPTTTVTETTPSSTTPTTETTIETTPTTTETTKSTTEVTTTPTTTETQSELSEVAPERLQFTKDLLNLYDESIIDTKTTAF
ncbi:MAG: hypothetical protein PHH12_00635, partial [Candidatus Shapirobacteria bacterium]|nr:hypothetical protein [Candidatus Shapirobacteria bacterium]